MMPRNSGTSPTGRINTPGPELQFIKAPLAGPSWKELSPIPETDFAELERRLWAMMQVPNFLL